MRIGIICEGGERGADIKVYKFLAEQILPGVEIIPAPLGSKPVIIEQCGKWSEALLELSSCERVIIIWDLQPAWEKNKKACRWEDCDLIRQSLNAAQLNLKQLSRVHLVCMEQELETLFLTDEQMIAVYLTQKSGRSCNVVNYSRYPTRPLDPKSVVDKFFREHSRQKHPYNATIDAEKMIQYVTIKKLKRCPSFVRFATKITDERYVSQILGIPLTPLMSEKQSQEEEH